MNSKLRNGVFQLWISVLVIKILVRNYEQGITNLEYSFRIQKINSLDSENPYIIRYFF